MVVAVVVVVGGQVAAGCRAQGWSSYRKRFVVVAGNQIENNRVAAAAAAEKDWAPAGWTFGYAAAASKKDFPFVVVEFAAAVDTADTVAAVAAVEWASDQKDWK